MDTYIHCIESHNGIRNNAFSLAYGDQALRLCREVYLEEKAGQTPENDDKLMVASLMGGLSLTYSEVGACHAISYGLSKIKGTRHCYANCVIFQHLEDIYPEGVGEFKQMLRKHNIQLPLNLSKDWDDDTITKMATVSINLPFMWNHAFGDNYKEIATLDYIKGLFRRL
jgi:3-deoxy-alpha-D-manno-octulosonate 8-oxidase